MKYISLLFVCLMALGCGSKGGGNGGGGVVTPPPMGPGVDSGVIRARAEYQVTSSQSFGFNPFKNLIQVAQAALGTVTVTYTNAASVNFTLNTSGIVAGGFTGDTLSLGSVALGSLSDNDLRVCGNGNQKCTQAVIRVYTTGAVAGFVHESEEYGVPVYAGNLNPTTEVGLGAANSVQVQVVTIANNVNRLRLSNFPSPTYPVSADFTNGGSGAYTMNFVVEYVLFRP